MENQNINVAPQKDAGTLSSLREKKHGNSTEKWNSTGLFLISWKLSQPLLKHEGILCFHRRGFYLYSDQLQSFPVQDVCSIPISGVQPHFTTLRAKRFGFQVRHDVDRGQTPHFCLSCGHALPVFTHAHKNICHLDNVAAESGICCIGRGEAHKTKEDEQTRQKSHSYRFILSVFFSCNSL